MSDALQAKPAPVRVTRLTDYEIALLVLAQKLARHPDHPRVVGPTTPAQPLHLSQRETEVLTLIARGLTNEEIARCCFLSPNTVHTHVRTAYRKIGVTRRAQAVGWCYQNGLSAPSDTSEA